MHSNRNSLCFDPTRKSSFLIRLAGPFVVGLFLALALNVGLGTLETLAAPLAPIHYVAPGANCGSSTPCYGTVQAAVDAAADGDEIRVAAGTYSGSVSKVSATTGFTYTQVVLIDGKSVSLKGGYTPTEWNTYAPLSNTTIIDAQHYGRGITILGDDTQEVSISGLQIINGDYTNLGNPPGVSNAGCYSTSGDCAGGLLAYYVKLILNDVLIRNNTASRIRPYSTGGGAFLWRVSDGTLIQNTKFFSNTNIVEGYGGGVEVSYATGDFTIRNSQFDNNHSTSDGGGLKLTSVAGPVLIENSLFVGNSAVGRNDAQGGAISANMLNDLTLDRVEFRDNRASRDGAAIFVKQVGSESPTLSLVNVLAAENQLVDAHTYGAAIDIKGGTGGNLDIRIQQTTVAANQTPAAIRIAQAADSAAISFSAAMTNTLFTDAAYGIVGAHYAGTLSINHTNSLFDNVIDQTAAEDGRPSFTASNAVTGDPKLDANQRLQANSAAIDAGANSGIALDLDGSVRPGGAGYDIGADEFAAASPGAFRFSQSAYSVPEANKIAITVERVNGTAGTVSVQYATSDGTASVGSDYVAATGTLTFAAGETEKKFMLSPTQDSLDESDETLALSLSNPTGGTILGNPQQVTVVIEDDDVGAAGEIKFEQAKFFVFEYVGSATITVKRTSPFGRVSVSYISSDDTSGSSPATAGIDYKPASGTLTFADGQTEKTFSVTIVNDEVDEGSETLRLVLVKATGGATLAEPTEATLVIRDSRPIFLPLISR